MALFSLGITCNGLGSFNTQCHADSPYSAVPAFLRKPSLDHYLAAHADWPRGYQMRDIFAFIPLDGLTNIYWCGLGQRGKYVDIFLSQTVQRRSVQSAYCGPRRKHVTLR